MPAGNSPTLLLLPTLPAARQADGSIVLTEKFVEGVEAFAEFWPGPVEVVFREVQQPTDNLDNKAYRIEELSFGASTADFGDLAAMSTHLGRCSIALGGLANEQTHLARLAAQLGTPFVYTTEYSLKTRLQIARVEVRNVLRRARRCLWEWNLERRQLTALEEASGVQCNGTPTYDEYHEVAANSLLFFDTRLRAEHLCTHEEQEAKLSTYGQRPLQLAFSGRLKEMKGVDHLVPFAEQLRSLGVDFRLDIFGDGVLKDQIAADIKRRGLEDIVFLPGNLDFQTKLLPRIKTEVDLFVACHRQGDPSCTYLETFGCGVPIAGYANEAFSGLLDRSVAGVKVPMDDLSALGAAVAELSADPERLTRMSRAALRFAELNTCEITFQRRTEHLLELSRNNRRVNA